MGQQALVGCDRGAAQPGGAGRVIQSRARVAIPHDELGKLRPVYRPGRNETELVMSRKPEEVPEIGRWRQGREIQPDIKLPWWSRPPECRTSATVVLRISEANNRDHECQHDRGPERGDALTRSLFEVAASSWMAETFEVPVGIAVPVHGSGISEGVSTCKVGAGRPRACMPGKRD